jgi:hypothetical protein
MIFTFAPPKYYEPEVRSAFREKGEGRAVFTVCHPFQSSRGLTVTSFGS